MRDGLFPSTLGFKTRERLNTRHLHSHFPSHLGFSHVDMKEIGIFMMFYRTGFYFSSSRD